MRQFMQRLRESAASFRRQESGNVLIMFGAVLPAFLGLTVAVIDYSRASAARAELQNGLDSATLFVARSEAVTNAQAQTVGDQVLRTNMAGNTQGTLTGSNFRIEANQRVVGSASASVPVSVMGLFGSNVINVSTSSEVTRSSNSVEVGIALDITGSMAGTPLRDMKAAAKELVDLIVKDVQTPHYSKVALIPYANAVNVGDLADNVRGALPSGVSTPAAYTPGYRQLRFKPMSGNSGNDRTYTASTCVTERVSSNQYTDASPKVTLVGRHYDAPAASGNVCPSAKIVPLTTNRTTLKSNIDTYQAAGSTAGHIGLAWAWYMVSESFGYLFPSASQPGPASDRELIKVVILMTDGDFNTPYRHGVIASDALSGSGDNTYKINLTSSNGSSTSQAEKLCAAIKGKGILLYTVGFNLTTTVTRNLMRDCATSAAHAYLPTSGTDLRDAFRAIGNEINSLRISR